MGTGPGRQQTESRCGWTGTRHTGLSWPGSPHRSGAWGWGVGSGSHHGWSVHPPHLLPGPEGLTGCRAGDTPLGSSGHPDPGPAGCMPHPLCGWCSDATHRRGPGGYRRPQLSPVPWAPSALPPPPAPPLRPPLRAPQLPAPQDSLSANNIHGFCLPSTHSLLGASTLCMVKAGLVQSWPH